MISKKNSFKVQFTLGNLKKYLLYQWKHNNTNGDRIEQNWSYVVNLMTYPNIEMGVWSILEIWGVKTITSQLWYIPEFQQVFELNFVVWPKVRRRRRNGALQGECTQLQLCSDANPVPLLPTALH